MNCRDISRLLAEHRLGQQTGQQQSDVERHLASCRHCAFDLEIHARLIKLPVPQMPADLTARCRAAVIARKGPGPYVLLGVGLALAAAAAMLALYLNGSAQRPAAELAQADPGVIRAPVPEVMTQAPGGGGAASPGESGPMQDGAAPGGASAGFSVQVLPPVHEATDPATRTAAWNFHAAFVEQLRVVPGLILLEPEPLASDVEPDFRILVTSKAKPPSTPTPNPFPWHVEMRVEALHGIRDVNPIRIIPRSFGADCRLRTPPLNTCSNAAGSAASDIAWLRVNAFPPNPSLMRWLQERIDERALPDFSRVVLFMDFVKVGRKLAGWRWDAASISSALNLVSDATSPIDRRQVLILLLGARHPALVEPLCDLLDKEDDESVRAAIVKILIDDFGTNAEARAALERLTRTEARQGVRLQAEDALGGAEGGRGMAMEILADVRFTEAERVSQLVRRSNGLDGGLIQILHDDAVLVQLAPLLRGIGSGPPELRPSDEQRALLTDQATLMLSLAPVRRTAATDMLIEAMRNSHPSVRSAAILASGTRRPCEDRVRKALEDAAKDPYPPVSGAAARALGVGACSAPQGNSPVR
jgi:HEAT repeat protein